MNIQLKSMQFLNIELNASDNNPAITSEVEIEMDVSTRPVRDSNSEFYVNFAIRLWNKSRSFTFNLKAAAHFEASEEIKDDFVNSMFLNVNAPAIAFPFIRTYISNITLNSGYNPIILNSVNFQRLFEERKSKETR